MNILIVIICLIAGFIAYKLEKKFYNPISLYMLVWGILFFVYNLGWYPLPQIKQSTYDIVITGLLSFIIASFITIIFYKPSHIKYKKERGFLIKAFLIFFFVSMIMPFLNGLRLLLGGADLHDIRYVYHDDIVGTGIGAIVFVYFSEPFLVFYLIYAVVNVFTSKNPIRPIILAMLGIFMMIVARGGRFYLLYFIFAILIAMLIYRKAEISKRVNRIVSTLAILGLVSVIAVTAIRGSDVGRTFYVYLSGSIPFLDHLLEENAGFPHTMGLYSLNGFIRPIFVVLRAFGIMELPIYMQFVEEISLQADEAYSIMPGELYNSFTTLFYSLFMDGGLIGVSIGNVILAIMSVVSFRKLDMHDKASVILFLLFAIILLLSFFRLLVSAYSYALAFFYVFICFKKTANR